MGKLINVKIGDTYSSLTIITVYPYVRNQKRRVRVRCVCGKEFDVNLTNLRQRWIGSCGCQRHANRRVLKSDEIIGTRYGHLVVLNEVAPKGSKLERYFSCRCDCGTVKDVALRHLRYGATTSCGCYGHQGSLTHGYSKLRVYDIWKKMKDRCFCKGNPAYSSYGGRGITMCDEWRNDPASFIEWSFSNGYTEDLTIDRIDNNGNYEPLNCRWVDMKVQSNNRRDNVYYPFNGEYMTIPEICRYLNILDRRYDLYYKVGKMKKNLIEVLQTYPEIDRTALILLSA
jgi:hypothetical protein